MICLLEITFHCHSFKEHGVRLEREYLKLSQDKLRIRHMARKAAVEAPTVHPMLLTPVKAKRASTTPSCSGSAKRVILADTELERELSSAMEAAVAEWFPADLVDGGDPEAPLVDLTHQGSDNSSGNQPEKPDSPCDVVAATVTGALLFFIKLFSGY
jgi:hypothetical protein